MFIHAATSMGYRVDVLTDEPDSPAAQIANRVVVGAYTDVDSVARLAKHVRAVTVEFENVSAEAAEAARGFAPLRPGSLALATSQHRLAEKRFLRQLGIPTAPFAAVVSEETGKQAIELIGAPGVLKTASSGYDGKGQIRIDHAEQLLAAWETLRRVECCYEGLIDFECELSMVAARGVSGDFRDWGLMHNDHASHILDMTTAPYGQEQLTLAAREMVRSLSEALDYIGVFCVEFFLTENGQLLVNEMAPRPHNSGHLTIEACVTSQFEQQVRAVCGLPLGDTRFHSPAAMANLLGDAWQMGEPRFDSLLSDPNIKLHLYGKHEARPGRKMGHITALGPTTQHARAAVMAARERCRGGVASSS